MQVEHKTEKGTIQFRLIPNDGNLFTTGITAKNPIPEGFEFIGLTSEIIEGQARMMIGKFEFGGPNCTYLDSFKSIMQFKKVYEVNPITLPDLKRMGTKQLLDRMNEYNKAQSRTCKWIVLFKTKESCKALSIKQPWATLIAANIKPIENRTWATKYRGRVYIHASQKLASVGFNSVGGCADLLTLDQWHSLDKATKSQLVRSRFTTSSIIGEVDIIDCVLGHTSIWAEHTATVLRKGIEVEVPVYNWVLANAVAYEQPILNVKGALSLWEYERPFEVVGTAELVNLQEPLEVGRI